VENQTSSGHLNDLQNFSAKVGHRHQGKTGTPDKIQEIIYMKMKKRKKKKNATRRLMIKIVIVFLVALSSENIASICSVFAFLVYP